MVFVLDLTFAFISVSVKLLSLSPPSAYFSTSFQFNV